MTMEMAPVTVAVVEPSSFFEGGGVEGGGVEGGGVAGGEVSPPSLTLLLSGSAETTEMTRRGAGLFG